MNKLEEKHFEVVTDLLMGLTAQKVAKDCTEITIEFAKRFSEWVSIMGYSINLEGFWFNHRDRNILTGNELIQKYIDTLNK